jgi:hypothetical protein
MFGRAFMSPSSSTRIETRERWNCASEREKMICTG